MKRLIILFFCILLSLSGIGQQIQNTQWKTLLGGADTLTVIAKIDTFYVNVGVDSNLVTALFAERGDTMLIRDLSGPYACVNPDTGYFQFDIVNDTMTLTLIQDLCNARGVLLDGAILWRAQNTVGVELMSTRPSINLFPNPNRGSFIVDISDHGYLQILDISGRKVYSEQLIAGKTSMNLNLSPGYYTALIERDGFLTSLKFIVDR